MSKNKNILLLAFVLINVLCYGQTFRIGFIGGYQMSFSDYIDLKANRLQSRSHFCPVYGITSTMQTKPLDIGLWVSYSRFSNELTPKYINTLPSSNLFPTVRRTFPVIQAGLSLKKNIMHYKKLNLSVLLTGGMNRSIILETPYPRDTMNTNTAYGNGTAYLAVFSVPSFYNTRGNMFLGSGLQMRYELLQSLILETSFQYQLGVGLLRGVYTAYHTWVDNEKPVSIYNTSTTTGSNLSLRMGLSYRLGKR